ncbi:inositol-pentakisphosphate 2-kinase [Pieris rapae]|uniref:inositol-pentakisphosphate 2-kinase n=1 Tax=Pieris rapae TaxID=64459 RepID=UPI001E27F46D|nr:inositol-pentakisphosphate 2-kinase [Pieris rapae]
MNTLNKKQWKYINEGNVHIVLQILDTCKVIRLIKDEQRNVDITTYINSIEFVNILMLPLVCKGHAYKEEILCLSNHEITELTTTLLQIRPKHRIHKMSISQFALSAPNLTILEPTITNYCVEIKTKEGFLAKTLEEYSRCYYCMKQFLKLCDKQIDKISKYCPLNLYSGDRKRMKVALVNLVENPQNNFKMFKNSEIIYSENSSIEFEQIISTTILNSTNVFFDLIINILLSDGESDIVLNETTGVIPETSHKCNKKQDLPPNSFLYNLVEIQSLSNNLNIDYTAIDDINISDLIKKVKDKNYNLRNSIDRKEFINSVDPLHLALISAVAKDCSVMITFTEQNCEGYPIIQFGDKKMSYRIVVTDLEPKTVKSIIKRKDTEKKLQQLIKKQNNNAANADCS